MIKLKWDYLALIRVMGFLILCVKFLAATLPALIGIIKPVLHQAVCPLKRQNGILYFSFAKYPNQ